MDNRFGKPAIKSRNKKFILAIFLLALIALLGYEVKKAGDIKEEIKNREIGAENKNQNEKAADWKIPEDEILIDLLEGDTNKDELKEVLIITEKPLDKKAFFYIFNTEGEKIYQKESGFSPDRAELRKFGDDDYDSFFLVFENQFEEGFFIRWNGKKYVVPGEEK